ncbi:hypothetical protein KY495_17540 [Massilia sp. PAMC28688]|uniref:hypothetical protein n=1 Tax=Massilia sp. PAMC28688 TaxID=2861283 RepID=UPI001C62DB5E|nr:hypothetical protein [Massilia sp. PAMC28688]QYF92532.1 hypothetical protein KY495_17540 [Massilia sp. PAMC28688]
MEQTDRMRLGATVFLAMVAFIRSRRGLQKNGALAVSLSLLLSIGLYVTGLDVAAQVVKCLAVAIAFGLILKERQWKRDNE